MIERHARRITEAIAPRPAGRKIEAQPRSAIQDELGLPRRDLRILAELEANPDGGRIDESLAKEAGERQRAIILGRAAELAADLAGVGRKFIVARCQVDRVQIGSVGDRLLEPDTSRTRTSRSLLPVNSGMALRS